MRPNPQETPTFVTFTEDILNGKLHFFSAVSHTFKGIVVAAKYFTRGNLNAW